MIYKLPGLCPYFKLRTQVEGYFYFYDKIPHIFSYRSLYYHYAGVIPNGYVNI